MTKEKLSITIKSFQEELSQLTLMELSTDPEIFDLLIKLNILINDFMMMINPKKRPLIINSKIENGKDRNITNK